MTTFAFLSDEWIEKARQIYIEASTRRDGEGPGDGPTITMNLVINQAPFGEGTLRAHVDSTDGIFRIDLGLLDVAEVTLTLDYKVARAILLEGDRQIGMKAFLTGKIRVEGNMVKLLSLQSSPRPDREDDAIMALRAMTSADD